MLWDFSGRHNKEIRICLRKIRLILKRLLKRFRLLLSLSSQVLDAQKLGTNNMWTASNELEQVVLAMVTKIIAENASSD